MSDLVHSFHWEYSYESARSPDYIPPHRRILCTAASVESASGVMLYQYTDVPEDINCPACVDLFALAALRNLP